MTMKQLIPLITIFAIVLSACGPGTSQDPLAGTSWMLTSIGNQGVVPGSNVTLSFQDGRASGNAGCNSYGGEYQLKGDTLKIEQLVSTLMACADSSMMDQETTYLEFLRNAQRFELADGQLQIYRSDGEALTFVPAQTP